MHEKPTLSKAQERQSEAPKDQSELSERQAVLTKKRNVNKMRAEEEAKQKNSERSLREKIFGRNKTTGMEVQQAEASEINELPKDLRKQREMLEAEIDHLEQEALTFWRQHKSSWEAAYNEARHGPVFPYEGDWLHWVGERITHAENEIRATESMIKQRKSNIKSLEIDALSKEPETKRGADRRLN